jgi:putative transposase
MSKRRTADQIVRLLRDADRDLAKGLTVADVCRQLGIAANTSYRWRQHYDPAQVDAARRIREREGEVERRKLLVAELLLDKKLLPEVAKKKW